MNIFFKKNFLILSGIVVVFYSLWNTFFKYSNKGKKDLDDPVNLPYSKEHYLQIVDNLKESMVGLGTSESYLKEVFSSITSKELRYINYAFNSLNKETLSTWLRSDLNNHWLFNDKELIELVKRKYLSAGLTY